jgi:hypothetical protein
MGYKLISGARYQVSGVRKLVANRAGIGYAG